MAAPQLEKPERDLIEFEDNKGADSESYVSFSKLKPPYLKEAKKISGFHVWYVDGSYVRKNIDTEFNNYGQHYRFNFIPRHEFWIDYEAKKELGYFVNHLLIEYKLMDEGKNYVTAVNIADRLEKKERQAKKEIKELLKKDKKNIINKIHKRILFKANKIKVWLVSGYLVRSLFNPSFTAGGHDKVYSFIPPYEIWIDNTIASKDWGFDILHELHERYLMSKNKNIRKKANYNDSHEQAIALEQKYMDNPEGLDERIKLELRRNNKEATAQKKLIIKWLILAKNSRESLKKDRGAFWEKNKQDFEKNVKEIMAQYKFPKPWKLNIITANFLSKKDKEIMPYDKSTWSFVDIVGATKKQGFDLIVFLHKSDLEYLSLPAMIPVLVHEIKHAYQAIKNPKKYTEQTTDDNLYKKFEAEAEAELRKYSDDFRKQLVLERIAYSYHKRGWEGAKKAAYFFYEECRYAFGEGYEREMEKYEYELFLNALKKKDFDLFIDSFIETFNTI
jgi:hypothetical protein